MSYWYEPGPPPNERNYWHTGRPNWSGYPAIDPREDQSIKRAILAQWRGTFDPPMPSAAESRRATQNPQHFDWRRRSKFSSPECEALTRNAAETRARKNSEKRKARSNSKEHASGAPGDEPEPNPTQAQAERDGHGLRWWFMVVFWLVLLAVVAYFVRRVLGWVDDASQ